MIAHPKPLENPIRGSVIAFTSAFHRVEYVVESIEWAADDRLVIVAQKRVQDPLTPSQP